MKPTSQRVCISLLSLRELGIIVSHMRHSNLRRKLEVYALRLLNSIKLHACHRDRVEFGTETSLLRVLALGWLHVLSF